MAMETAPATSGQVFGYGELPQLENGSPGKAGGDIAVDNGLKSSILPHHRTHFVKLSSLGQCITRKEIDSSTVHCYRH